MSIEAGSNPFVGLRPFESDESLLFFGRQEQTLELLDRLHQHHFVAVIGSSGSGKSSLIRAGLVPRLQAGYLVNDSDRWVITIMKPGQTPICNLADALLSQPSLATTGLTSTSLEQQIKEKGVDAVLDLLEPLWASRNNLFLLVDQFEELFRFSIHQDNFDKKDEAKDFVNILLALAAVKERPIYVVTTMRSDFIGDCSLIYGLPEAMNKSQYIVPRLNRQQLRNAIEGPVRLYKGKINAALTARLLNDAQLVNDELPLLQHVLMRIWDYEENQNRSGELELEDYHRIGGIEKALSNHADEALQDMTEEEKRITKKLFQSLTTVDENARKIRRPVRLTELEKLTGTSTDRLLSIIRRFVEGNRSFLVLSNIPATNDKLIDISHESLIRQWNTLSQWVDEEAEGARLFSRLTESARLYQQKQGDLLAGNELQLMTSRFGNGRLTVEWARRYSNVADQTFTFLRSSEKQWEAVQKEKERQRRQKQRTRRALMAALVIVILIISGFAYAIYRNNKENKRQLALSYWSTSQTLQEKNDLLSSLQFAAEAIPLSNSNDLTKNILLDIEPALPQAALHDFFYFPDIVFTAVFHPTKKQLLVTGNDGSVRLIHLETGEPAVAVMMHGAPVSTGAFSLNGKLIATGSGDRTARIWDAGTGKVLLTLRHPGTVTSVAFSPDGAQLVTACADSYVRFWNTAHGGKIDSVEHADAATTAVFSSNGRWLLTGSADSTAVLWDAATKKQLHVFNHNATVTAVEFSSDDTRILTASHDSTVMVLDVATKQKVLALKNTSKIISAGFSPDGGWITTAGEDGYAKLWDVATGKQAGAALKHDGPVHNIAFDADGKQLATTGWDRVVRIWKKSAPKKSETEDLGRHSDVAVGAAFNHDGTKVVTASDDSTSVLWDLKTKKRVVLKHPDFVRKAVFSPDGKRVLTTCSDGIIRLWKGDGGEAIMTFVSRRSLFTDAGFGADGKTIYLVENYRNVFFVEAANLEPVDSFTYNAVIQSVVLSKDGNTILIAGSDNRGCLVNRDDKKTLASFKHQNLVSSAVFSPNGKLVLTASYDRKVILWNIATQQQVGPAMQHDGNLKAAAFSPDGKWILTTSFGGTVRLWDATTAKPVSLNVTQEHSINSAVFSPDGTAILTADNSGYIRLWKLEGDLDIPADLFRLQAKALTGMELNVNTGETTWLSADEWKDILEMYRTQGKKHHQACRYKAFNLWSRFYATEAGTKPQEANAQRSR